MSTRFLPLHPTDTAYWALLTCPEHTAGDLEIKREGNFYEIRCRECAAKPGLAASGWTDGTSPLL